MKIWEMKIGHKQPTQTNHSQLLVILFLQQKNINYINTFVCTSTKEKLENVTAQSFQLFDLR